MNLPETLTFDIVTVALTRTKRNIIIVLLFIGWMGMAVLLAAICKTKIVMPFCVVPFVFLVMLVSNKAMKLKKIGNMTMNAEDILLINKVRNIRRVIPVKEIKNIFIRGGGRSNLTGTMKRLTLFLDFTLKNKELVIVHIEVPEDDVLTCDRISVYLRSQWIKCDRKI